MSSMAKCLYDDSHHSDNFFISKAAKICYCGLFAFFNDLK